MNEQEHAQRHRELHAALDELLADWLDNGRGVMRDVYGRFGIERPISDLLQWSHAQTTAAGPDHAASKPS